MQICMSKRNTEYTSNETLIIHFFFGFARAVAFIKQKHRNNFPLQIFREDVIKSDHQKDQSQESGRNKH